ILEGKPSKEYPMHLKLYENDQVNCVIHTHSFYSTLISCIKNIENHLDLLYKYTPYLYMQTKGNIQVVDYALPGSEELFQKMYQKVNLDTNVYLLKNHGVFVSGEEILKCFYLLEEFESSARILQTIENLPYNKIQ
ncbi:MAG: class II aldolase/adducin family protein, partial [Traorella sp.]